MGTLRSRSDSGTAQNGEVPLSGRSQLRLAFAYTLMVCGAIGIFFGVRSVGTSLHAQVPVDLAHMAPHVLQKEVDVLLHVMLALATVMICARSIGALFRRLHQPAVMGEIVAGIVLGPSVLGHIAPAVSAYILPADVAPYLGLLAQIGVILYMFVVGLELDPGLVRRSAHTSLAISHASIVVPFLLGSALSLYLYPRFSTGDVDFTAFALFIGVSMSVTAFPVLARILTDLELDKTRLGTMALTCAAADDVSAWCLLALVVSIVQAEPGRGLVTFISVLAYMMIMLAGVRPLVVRYVRGMTSVRLKQSVLAAVFGGLLLSALVTEYIGVHAVFGAFMFGVIIPHDSELSRQVSKGLTDVVSVFLLPAFFAFTGMRTQIGLVAGAYEWLVCGGIVLVASIGKFGGTLIASRFMGQNLRDGAALGVLMNTRGLMELIVLNIGLDLGVISPMLFTMLVIMAVVTTFATTPVLRWLVGGAESSRGKGKQ